MGYIARLVLLGLVVACLVLPLAGQITGKYRMVPVLGASMEPALQRGDLSWVVPADARDIRVGDVIVFDPPPAPGLKEPHKVIHRVITVLQGPELARVTQGRKGAVAVLTKGDANASPDPWQLVLDRSPVWRQNRVIPKAGYPLVWAANTLVRAIAVLALLGAGVVLAVPVVRRKRRLRVDRS